MFAFLFKSPADLLKKATELKKEGKIDAAIEALKKAYSGIRKEGKWSYPVETYLRLPLYLGEAGRIAEAKKEFSLLLQNGYFKELPYPDIVWGEKSKILDKMRVFAKRNGEEKEAVVFGLLSFLASAQSMRMRKEVDNLLAWLSADNERKAIQQLLKKSGAEGKEPELLAFLSRQASSLASLDLSAAQSEILTILG